MTLFDFRAVLYLVLVVACMVAMIGFLNNDKDKWE